MTSPFVIGDEVVTAKAYSVDYTGCTGADNSDCSHATAYTVPAGSRGIVVSDVQDGFADGAVRVAVCFHDTENFFMLLNHGKMLGPGHYIPLKILEAAAEAWAPISDSHAAFTAFLQEGGPALE